MPTAKKEAAIAELQRKLLGSTNLFLTDYTGLTVEQITRLRGELRKDGSSSVSYTHLDVYKRQQLDRARHS